MDLILCHLAADSDTLGAAVGLTQLLPGAQIVLVGAAPPTRCNLAPDDFAASLDPRSLDPRLIQHVVVVGMQRRDRLGPAAAWLDLLQVEITIYDRQIAAVSDIATRNRHVAAVGATTTLVVEQMQAHRLQLSSIAATVMAAGMQLSLTAPHQTGRDTAALVWLAQQGAQVHNIAPLQLMPPSPPIAQELMSAPSQTISPETAIAVAQQLLQRHGYSGLAVVDVQGQLVGMISRRDLDIAAHYGGGDAAVRAYMTTEVRTIALTTPLPTIADLMVTYDIEHLPVVAARQLVGIVTRTDVLRRLHPPRWALPPLTNRLAPPLQAILAIAAQQAQQQGWQLYLVGGAVRDLALAQLPEAVMLTDLDLVVDGYGRTAAAAAGVELARSLQHHYPAARLEIHGKFQTAALLWPPEPGGATLSIDVATARTEVYAYPAANPEVAASSIQQDLYRRDFTINALAVRLTQPHQGEILDFFGGRLDLQAKQIRVLHANSFIEDPTRIFRAVRFAVRLGFELEPQTVSWIQAAIASGIYPAIQQRVLTARVSAPALQSRLRSELKYILQAPYWQAALRQLAHLGALQCLHVHLKLEAKLWRQLRWVERLQRLAPAIACPPWQMLLETLIAQLDPTERIAVAHMLQLPRDSCTRLTQLAPAQAHIMAVLSPCDRPSQVVQCLQSYDLPLLLLIAVRSNRPLRHQIWRYLTQWSQVRPLLDGQALKALGYQPGRQFKHILADLLAATIDGVVCDRHQAETFLLSRYPQSNKKSEPP